MAQTPEHPPSTANPAEPGVAAENRPPSDRDPVAAHSDEAAPRPSRVPIVLVVIATALAVVGSLTTWVRTQMLDTDEWVSISEEMLADPDVQEALAVYLGNELFERVDVQSAVAERLPDDLSSLAGPLVGAVREPITNGIENLVASDRFRQLWIASNRRAHETLVAIIRDETRPGISTADGTVTLEGAALLRNVGESIGLSDSVLDRIPPDAGNIVVFQSDVLDDAQTAVRVLDFLSWFLLVAVVGLYALAVALARDRRVQAFHLVGVGLLIGGLLVLALRSIGVRLTLDSVVNNPVNGPASTAIAQIATSLLRSMAWSGIVFGTLIIGCAFLIGEHERAERIRRRLQPTSTLSMGVAAIGLVVALLWWNPGDAFGGWIAAVALVALVGVTFLLLGQRVAQGVPSRLAGEPGD